MTPLRLGFLGAGGLSGIHMRGFHSIPSVKIAAAADLNETALAKLQKEFEIPSVYSSYHSMLEKEKLDAAVIVLPTSLHKEATLACLDAGLHVLCEKPPANDFREMQEIAQKVRSVGTTYMFCRQSRFTPLVAASRKLISEGRLGTICGSQAHWIRSRGPQLKGQSWRQDRTRGGGVLLDLGIHGLDTVWFCLGCPKPIEVSATEFTAFRDFSSDPSSYTADDGAVGWIRFDNGSVLQYKFAFGMNVTGPWLVGKDQKLDRPAEWQSYRIYGTQGGVDIYANEFVTGPLDKLIIEPILTDGHETSWGENIAVQAREFIRAIQTGDEPLNSLGHAVTLMQILTALRESSQLQKAIFLH